VGVPVVLVGRMGIMDCLGVKGDDTGMAGAAVLIVAMAVVVTAGTRLEEIMEPVPGVVEVG